MERARVYEPFPAWLFCVSKPAPVRGYFDLPAVTLDSLPVGEVQVDEAPLANGGGHLLFFRVAHTALTGCQGCWVARLECVGPTHNYHCRQRKVLWVADASAALHRFALWCAEQKLATLTDPPTRAKWEAVLARKQEAIDPAAPGGCRPWHRPGFEPTEENPYPSPPKHVLFDALRDWRPRTAAWETWEAVRLGFSDDWEDGVVNAEGWRQTPRERFVQEARAALERFLLELAPEVAGEKGTVA